MRSGFSNDAFDFQERPQSPDSRFASALLATVTEVLPRFRVNVITTFGEPFKKVRTIGPFLKQNGNAHGRAFGIKKDQLVLLEFIAGSYRAPVITQVFPFATKDSDLSNLQSFWSKFSFIDPEKDIIDFHESGYCIRKTTHKIEIYNENQVLVFSLDFENKKAKLKVETLEIEGETTFKGNTKFEGDLTIEGDTDQTGKITVSEDVIIDGIPAKNHGHTYSPGPSPPTKTGPPI
ncbi:baseplate assembly protein [Leptospira yasudae]|uniref:baseplate assembly protein n=1 Tax=Leptospira yasudae TaxID=2202201 RepID=UPI000E59DE0B|nr:baseplate assembly protein [Leptospira yasudae]RHX90257.1 baseplate assembly protein [Leptospira yasudae]